MKLKKDGWMKNISYTFAGKVIAALSMMLLDIVAARFLGVETYAEWAYFFSILTMLYYLGWFGIDESVRVHVSKCTNENELSDCLHASHAVRIVCSFLISLAIFAILPLFAGKLGYPQKYPNLLWLLGISGILVLLNSITDFYKSLFVGLSDFKRVYIITVVEYCGYFFFSVLFLLLFHSVKALAYGYLLGGLAVSVLDFFSLNKSRPGFFGQFGLSCRRYIKPILTYAMPIMVLSIGSLVLVEMDTFMLGLFSTAENVATYNIAKNLCLKALHVNYTITVGTINSFAIIETANRKKQQKSFLKVAKISALVTAAVSFGFLLFAEIAIRVVYGSDYMQAATLLRALIPYYALAGISNFYASFMDLRGKVGFRSICYLSVALINFVLNYLWIPKFGVLGAAVATDISILPYSVMTIIVSYREWKKIEE